MKYHLYHVSLHQELNNSEFPEVQIQQAGPISAKTNSGKTKHISCQICKSTFITVITGTQTILTLWESKHQVKWPWTDILNGIILRPVYYTSGMTARCCVHDILMTMVFNFLEELPLEKCAKMQFQHDGTPLHSFGSTKWFLKGVFSAKWIGHHGPWPPWSPNLAQLDRINDAMYQMVSRGLEALQQKTTVLCCTLSPQQLKNAAIGVLYRCQLCIGQHSTA